MFCCLYGYISLLFILSSRYSIRAKQTFWGPCGECRKTKPSSGYFLKNFLMHFRFWGTCEEHARELHRYTRGSVMCCLPPHHLYLAFLPMLSLPNSSPPAVPPLFLPYRPQCVILPSLCPCVLIVQHPPISENMQCLIFCSCVSLLKMMISRFIHVPTKDTNSSVLMAA